MRLLLSLLLCGVLSSVCVSAALTTVPLSFINILSTGATAVTIKAGIVDVLAANVTSQNVNAFSFASTYPKFANNDMTNFATLLAAFTANAPAPVNTTAIILDGTTQSTNGLSYLAAYYRIPLVSCSINPANLLLQSSVYPYVISNYTPDRLLVDAFFELAVQLGWTRVAVFATLESTGITILSYLYQRMADYPQIDVLVFYVAYPDVTQFKLSTLTQLGAMRQQEYYIGFLGLYKANMVSFLNYAYSVGMTGPPYQWVGINGMCSSTGNIITGALVSPAAGLGVLCLLQGLPHSVQTTSIASTTAATSNSTNTSSTSSSAVMTYTEFLWRFNGQGGMTFANQLQPWSACYDAVFLLAKGLQSLLTANQGNPITANNGTQLLAAMRNVSMTGPATTFPISFDSRGQMASSSVDVLQYVPHPDLTYTRWQYIGTYWDALTAWELVSDLTFYSTQGNTVPLDYVPVLSDGSVMSVTYNAAAGVVPAVLLLVSLWTSNMTLRYAVVSKRRSRHPVASHSLLSRCCPLSVSSLWHWPSSAFVLLASLQFSLGAVVSFHYATFALQDVTSPFSPLQFTTQSFIGACCLSIVTSYVSFLLSYSQVEFHSLAARDAAGHSSRVDSRSHTGDNSIVKGQKVDRLQKQLQKASTFIFVRWAGEALALVSSIPPLTAVSAALLTGSVCGTLHVAVSGFVLPADTSVNAGLAAIVAPVLLVFPVWCYCCHVRSRVLDAASGIKCLLLGGAVMQVEQVIDMAAYSFRFSQSKYSDADSFYNSSASVLSADSVLVFCSVVVAFVVFGWLGLTMHVNQMSKGILDLLLMQARKGRMRAESELQASEQQRLTTLEQLVRMRKYAAINAGVRPLYREYAYSMDINRLQDNSAPEAGTALGGGGITSPSQVASPKARGERMLLAGRSSDLDFTPGSSIDLDGGSNMDTRMLAQRVMSSSGNSTSQLSVAAILPEMRSPSLNMSGTRTLRIGSAQTKQQQQRHARPNRGQQHTFTATNANTQLIMTMYQELDSAELLDRWQRFASTPLPPAILQSITMRDLLCHCVTLELVKDTALARQQEEGKKGLLEAVVVWLDLQRYCQTTDRTVRAVLAKEIISTFFVEPCPHPVAISLPQKKMLAVSLKLYRASDVHTQQQAAAALVGVASPGNVSTSASGAGSVASLSLFNGVELELYSRLSEEVLPVMRSSPVFHACALLLSRVDLRVLDGDATGQSHPSDDNGDDE